MIFQDDFHFLLSRKLINADVGFSSDARTFDLTFDLSSSSATSATPVPSLERVEIRPVPANKLTLIPRTGPEGLPDAWQGRTWPQGFCGGFCVVRVNSWVLKFKSINILISCMACFVIPSGRPMNMNMRMRMMMIPYRIACPACLDCWSARST